MASNPKPVGAIRYLEDDCWEVTSSDGTKEYMITREKNYQAGEPPWTYEWTCSCPAKQRRPDEACKHIKAVQETV